MPVNDIKNRKRRRLAYENEQILIGVEKREWILLLPLYHRPLPEISELPLLLQLLRWLTVHYLGHTHAHIL